MGGRVWRAGDGIIEGGINVLMALANMSYKISGGVKTKAATYVTTIGRWMCMWRREESVRRDEIGVHGGWLGRRRLHRSVRC